jgi:hypothetical protein
VAILSDRKVIKKKEVEKKLKYKNLSTEIQRVWNMKCLVITIITGVAVTVTKRLKEVWK